MKRIFFVNKINQSDDAVVGIVVAVLFIGLILIVITMINAVYVPQWLENSEANHMSEVKNQFTQLKYALDMQTIVNDSTAITSPVTLGTKEIPFFDRGRTFDSIEIIKNAITIDFDPGGSYTSDAIIFSSGNMYFVDQSFIYESGSLIISQNNDSELFGSAPIIVTEYGKNITFYITEIRGLEGKTHISGHGTYPIFTKVDHIADDIVLNNVTTITITTEYPQAWMTVFQQVLETPGFDYEINLDSYNEISITFNIVDNNILIHNRDIITQLAFGLAEGTP